jgi:hypothetical protein
MQFCNNRYKADRSSISLKFMAKNIISAMDIYSFANAMISERITLLEIVHV